MKDKEFAQIWKQVLGRLRLEDFVIRGGLAFKKPVEHVLRGLDCDRSIDPRSFYVWVFVMPLYAPHKILHYSLGWRLTQWRSWEADNPELVENLAKAIQSEALPFLERIKGPADIPEAARICRRIGNPVVDELVALSFAKVGDIQKAVETLDTLTEALAREDLVKWQVELLDRAKHFRRLLLEDPLAARKELERWEQETVMALKLDEFWVKGNEA